MKKVLSIALALAVVLSLSVTAFATDVTGTTDGEVSVYAKTTQTLSATVDWADMYFVYDQGLQTWTNTGSNGVATNSGSENNKVTVTNNTYGSAINVKAQYTQVGGKGINGARAFADQTLSRTVGGNDGTLLTGSNAPATVLTDLAAKSDVSGGSGSFWFMFTAAPTDLSGTFQQVGTLTLSITQ